MYEINIIIIIKYSFIYSTALSFICNIGYNLTQFECAQFGIFLPPKYTELNFYQVFAKYISGISGR